jgi:site-specific recombinase XerD
MKPYSLNANKFLSPEELKHLRRVLDMMRAKEPRNVLLIDLALATGARASELLGIRKNHVSHERQSVFIQGIKGSDDREIPLQPALFENLAKYTGSVEHVLFAFTYVQLQRIWHLYRPVPKGFHSLRHTFAIELYRKTKDLRLLKVALGHRSIANTMIYADYQYSVDELRRLIYG